MDLCFGDMIVRDFRTYLGKHTLQLNNEPGLYHLRGRNKAEPSLEANDAGKSTLWAALCWGLWGRTPKGLRSPALRPWSLKKAEPAVFIPVQIDGAKHMIERSMRTNGLRLDDKSCGEKDIERLLRMNFETFTNSILLAQGQPLFFDRAPREKLELFGGALNIDRWDVRSTTAADDVKRLEQKLAKYEGELTATKGALDELIRSAKHAKAKATVWREEQDQRVSDWETELAKKQDDLKQNADRKAAADLAHDGSGTEAKILKQEIASAEGAYEDARDKLTKFTIAFETLKENKRKLERELQTLGKADKCPTCNQKIAGTALGKHKNEMRLLIEKAGTQIDNRREGLEGHINEVATLKRTLDKNKADLRAFEEKADEALSTFRRVADVVAKLEADIANLKAKITDELRTKNVYQEQYERLKKDVQSAKADVIEIETDIIRTKRLIEQSKPWIKGFKDIRLDVINEALEQLELLTNDMLPEFGLEDWVVRYDIERETKSGTTQRGFNVTILSPKNDEPVQWEVWGGGVGQRLRIVGARAFAQTLLSYAGVRCNLEILDEPAVHMTRGGVRNLCDYLAQQAIDEKKSIWFTDHLSVESDRFHDILTVVKDGKGSQLVWG